MTPNEWADHAMAQATDVPKARPLSEAATPAPAGPSVPMPAEPAVVADVRRGMRQAYSLADASEEARRTPAGTLTGFRFLDEKGWRWKPTEVSVVAARPGSGKTAFMLEACMRVIESHPEARALFVTWELARPALVQRLLCREDAKLHAHDDWTQAQGNGPGSIRGAAADWLREPNTVRDPAVLQRLDDAASMLEGKLARLHLVDGDTLGRDALAVLNAVGRVLREPGTARPALVAVDYFQKLRAPNAAAGSRQQELAAVSDALRRLAKGQLVDAKNDAAGGDMDTQHAVAVLVGAQLRRGGPDTLPTVDEIREADDLLNDATGALVLRWDVHRAEQPGAPGGDERRRMGVHIGKNRNGGTSLPGTVAWVPWRPALDWLAPDAIRDKDSGAVLWCEATAAPAKPTPTQRVMD